MKDPYSNLVLLKLARVGRMNGSSYKLDPTRGPFGLQPPAVGQRDFVAIKYETVLLCLCPIQMVRWGRTEISITYGEAVFL